MGSRKITRSKVEGIKDILSRGMSNSKLILSRDTLNKDIPNKLIRNKAIPNKVMHNKDTGSNRAMDNHLPGMRHLKKRRP